MFHLLDSLELSNLDQVKLSLGLAGVRATPLPT
jgi:hypothetical protein